MKRTLSLVLVWVWCLLLSGCSIQKEKPQESDIFTKRKQCAEMVDLIDKWSLYKDQNLYRAYYSPKTEYCIYEVLVEQSDTDKALYDMRTDNVIQSCYVCSTGSEQRYQSVKESYILGTGSFSGSGMERTHLQEEWDAF